MNRWDQEMLMGQISPEELNYYGLMPNRDFRQADYGNGVSLGDIRPEENFLMRAQEVNPIADAFSQFRNTKGQSPVGSFLDTLNDPSNMPSSIQPYISSARDKIRGSFGGAGGMAMDAARNAFQPSTMEDMATSLSLGTTGKIPRTFGIERVPQAIGKAKSAIENMDPMANLSPGMMKNLQFYAKDIFNTHNPQVGNRIEMNLPGGNKTINDISAGLAEVYKREGKQGLSAMIDELLNAEPGDLSALAMRYTKDKLPFNISDTVSGMGQDARQGVGGILNQIAESTGLTGLMGKASNAWNAVKPELIEGAKDYAAQYGPKIPGSKKVAEKAAEITGPGNNKEWYNDLSFPNKERYIRGQGKTGNALKTYYRDIAESGMGIKDIISQAISQNPTLASGIEGLKTGAKYGAAPAGGAGLLAMLPGADKTNAVASEPGLAKRMIDSLFGKGYDLGDIVDVPMQWRDGGGYTGRYEYNPRAATIRTNNMRDLSDAERYALEQEARKYAGDFASAANTEGQLPGRKVTMLPTYIKYLRELL